MAAVLGVGMAAVLGVGVAAVLGVGVAAVYVGPESQKSEKAEVKSK